VLCCLDFARKLFEIRYLTSSARLEMRFTRMFTGFQQNKVGAQAKTALMPKESTLTHAAKATRRRYFRADFHSPPR
jgi:hypothetical protein